ncbi:ArnT family glycosyltransferase [Lutibacter maritimus]|uniref:Dolichyl-phosphate-mannose-protein mannosyltransferase n=1 Tax=Lutibacter maritimus TaxID=593133 RepID=A0A1I6SJK3_9FLAO|nr:glycosyltransferase family 39 protein [Lutibacter maritimus]SFS77030.1 Dolichyl-phosphate-mannose-protein mannosyltransferase [Lutibacter maritimus]
MTLFSKKISPFALLVIALLLFRAVLNYSIPLMDKTEARYAEISRIMAETNDFVTPQIDYNVPFWAKPPLSTWLSAISIKAFGENEFAVRFPYLILNILVLLLIGRYAKEKKLNFFIPAFVLLTIPEFLIHTGVVSTDTALAFCVTLVMISFWEAVKTTNNQLWKYLFFIGLGLGMLAKGPIIFILTAPPIFVWMVFFKEYKAVWKNFNWFLGILLFAIIAVPWYYLAELKTPGFIDYFIVGEHFKRFFDSSWQGDKYGFPKSQPMGMIWLFLIAFAIPWILLVIQKVWQKKLAILKDKWVLFLLLWLLWTPGFFTVSKSLIHPYIMPVMVPIALLITYWWEEFKHVKQIVYISLIFPGLALILFIGIQFNPKLEYYINSDKYLISNNTTKEIPLYCWKIKSYSSQFYSKGAVKVIKNEQELINHLNKGNSFLLLISHKRFKKMDPVYLKSLQEIDKNNKNGMYLFEK